MRIGKRTVLVVVFSLWGFISIADEQFAAYTEAERELKKLLEQEDEEIDLAVANWLIVADIPQFKDMPREEYFKQLDNLTDRVRKDIAFMQPIVRRRGGDPDTPHGRCNLFCGAMIRLHLDYREEFQKQELTVDESKALYADANNVFLAGLLRTKRGSCVSMPMLYLIIGRRLGYPVHLVNVGRHCFIRWEEPGYRMNIETTIVERVCMTADDNVHLEIEGKTKALLQGSEMRNLGNREVIGNLFFIREGHWEAKLPKFRRQLIRDIKRANYLAPDDPSIQAVHQIVMKSHIEGTAH